MSSKISSRASSPIGTSSLKWLSWAIRPELRKTRIRRKHLSSSLSDLASRLFPLRRTKLMHVSASVEALLGTSDKWWPDTTYQRPKVPYAMSRYVRRLPLCKGEARGPQAEAGKTRRRRLLARRGRAPIRRANRPWQYGQLRHSTTL